MNTDSKAAEKPEYPVIDHNLLFTKTVANFDTLAYLRLFTITGVSVTVDYLSELIGLAVRIKLNFRGPSIMTSGLIGFTSGFMYAYQSAGRLMGFLHNGVAVARYKKA